MNPDVKLYKIPEKLIPVLIENVFLILWYRIISCL